MLTGYIFKTFTYSLIETLSIHFIKPKFCSQGFLHYLVEFIQFFKLFFSFSTSQSAFSKLCIKAEVTFVQVIRVGQELI